MKTAVFAYSRRGCETARTVAECLPQAQLYTVERLKEDGFCAIPRPSGDFYGTLFSRMEALIFVGACGIAVRAVAPHLRSKTEDPAVVVVDELGQFVIALLSGHIGGANALADTLAQRLGAVPVITTATDRNRRFSADAWAARNGFALSSMEAAKAVSAAILEKEVPLKSDFSVAQLPRGVIAGESGAVGMYLTCGTAEPFDTTLRLIPRALHLGIGCRRGTPCEAIEAAVEQVLRAHSLDARAVACVSSVDLKAGEPGLVEFGRRHGWKLRFYTPEALRQVPGDFTPSAFVQQVTGVDNVCERSAMVGADRLIVRKTALGGVTVAVAEEYVEVSFGETDCGGHRPG